MDSYRKYSNFTKLHILGKLVVVLVVPRTMATKSRWILLLVACLLSAVLGKCINLMKRTTKMESLAGFADFGASEHGKVVFSFTHTLVNSAGIQNCFANVVIR